jgi:hypothetical protein
VFPYLNFHPRSPQSTSDRPTLPAAGLGVFVVDKLAARDTVEVDDVPKLDDDVDALELLLVLRVDEDLCVVDELVIVVGASVVDVVDDDVVV